MRSREPGRTGPLAGAGFSDGDTTAECSRSTELIQLRLPAARVGQLQALADRQGVLASAMISDWVLAHLAEHDSGDALLPTPARVTATGARLASVTHLPRLGPADPTRDADPARDAEPGPDAGPACLAPAHRDPRQVPPVRVPPARRRPPGSEAHPAGMRLPGATGSGPLPTGPREPV